MFVNPAVGDFTLKPDSPCIDAGNPESTPDPDGTITDMGAWYFDQSEYSLKGDLNQDQIINVLDVIINVEILISGTPTDFETTVSNLNSDGVLNILDVVVLVNVILVG